MIQIELWREDVPKLDNVLKFVDAVDIALKLRAKIKTYDYSKYVCIDKLELKGGVRIQFDCKVMELFMLKEIEKIAFVYDLEIYANHHECSSNYYVDIKLTHIERKFDIPINTKYLKCLYDIENPADRDYQRLDDGLECDMCTTLGSYRIIGEMSKIGLCRACLMSNTPYDSIKPCKENEWIN